MTAFPAYIKVRRPTMDDVSAVMTLMLARNQAEHGEADMTEEHIRNFWQAFDFNICLPGGERDWAWPCYNIASPNFTGVARA